MTDLADDFKRKLADFLCARSEFQDKEHRRLLLRFVIGDQANLDYEGDTRTFVRRLILWLLDFGQLPSGKYALVALLEELKLEVGQDKQGQIDELVGHLESQLPAKAGDKSSEELLYMKNSVAHLEADLRVIGKIWGFVKSKIIERVVDGVQYRMLDFDFYMDTVGRYQYLRENYPEYHLVISELESVLIMFDEALGALHQQLITHSSIKMISGEKRLVPHYKLPESYGDDLDYEEENERREYLESQFDIDIEKANELRQMHMKLVETIKRVLPQFELED